MMYNLVERNPALLDTRDKGLVLRSSNSINFIEQKLDSESYIKSPFVRGCNIWKQLSPVVQKANTKTEFNRMLTDDLLNKLM